MSNQGEKRAHSDNNFLQNWLKRKKPPPNEVVNEGTDEANLHY